jgi:imidazoleglycerol-phosphate dehydratase
MVRSTEISRKTKETDITLSLALDGAGLSRIDTGIGFLDHMLTLFAKHGHMNLTVICKGDLDVDSHHTVEDIGIVLGQAIFQCLGSKESIRRYGSCFVPMDETLVLAAVDISNRPFLVFDLPFSSQMIGMMDTEMFEEFFRAVTQNAGLTLHVKLMHGHNNHHIAEAAFKAFARALHDASFLDPTIDGVMSTKGVL